MKLIKPDLENRDYEFNEGFNNPDIENILKQALAYLIGYDLTNETFRFLNIDSEGRLYVSSGSVKADNLSVGVATVEATASIIANSNEDRKYIEIINNSLNTIYLGSTTTITINTGFPVPSGASWYTEMYLGEIYGIASLGFNDVRYMEMY